MGEGAVVRVIDGIRCIARPLAAGAAATDDGLSVIIFLFFLHVFLRRPREIYTSQYSTSAVLLTV